MARPTVYAAGPDLFYPNAQARYAAIAALCDEFGFDLWTPEEDPNGPALAQTPEVARHLSVKNEDRANNCDILLANFQPFLGSQPDPGTVWEACCAYKEGNVVTGYIGDALTMAEREKQYRTLTAVGDVYRDAEGVLVEDFGLPANLMIAVPCQIFQTPRQALVYAVDQLSRKWDAA